MSHETFYIVSYLIKEKIKVERYSGEGKRSEIVRRHLHPISIYTNIYIS